MALCARNAHITVYDVTTWSWVNLVPHFWMHKDDDSWIFILLDRGTSLNRENSRPLDIVSEAASPS